MRAEAVLVQVADAVHCPRVAEKGRLVPPLERFRVILRPTMAIGVHQTEIVHRHGVAAPGRLLPPVQRFDIALFAVVALGPEQGNVIHRSNIALAQQFRKCSRVEHALAGGKVGKGFLLLERGKRA